MKQQLRDFNVKDSTVEIKCDNTSAIHLTKNPIMHLRVNHIDIKHHFIRDHVLKGDINVQFIDTKQQLADIFTKPLEKKSFELIRDKLNIIIS